ncbi:hypothetical protein [Pseudomonas zeae]|uniref:hypothetical protein n=1 Tax=Pseudomonas zeae TaxID=2745510 RepID=UPI003D00454E
MTDFLSNIWAFLNGISTIGLTVTLSLVTSLIAAIVSIWNAQRLLGVQRLSNARSASTFIADKRQKWIDDLRNDASRYLSLSLEIAEAWKQLYWKCGAEYDENPNRDPSDVLNVCESLRIRFINDNSGRDSEHHQLYMRIILRLNNEECTHLELSALLGNLRLNMKDLALAALKGTYSNQGLFDSIENSLERSAASTKIILKEEWQRLKFEVADPDRLIAEILSGRKSNKAAARLKS